MILVDSAELLKEVAIIIDAAECAIASEKLGGNVVKENYWRGELCAAESIRLWVQGKIDRVPGSFKKVEPPEVTTGRRTHADYTAPKD